MTSQLRTPTPVQRGDKVAVLSPAWAAPGYFPQIHEQAMERLRTHIGVEPVEFPTTRALGATPQERAADINEAFADPTIRAILTSVGGDDLIRVVPYLDPDGPLKDPKPFFGYSDNTNVLNWLWNLGVASYHGGATMVHLGPAHIDDLHLATLKAALFASGDILVTSPLETEDFGYDWSDTSALHEAAPREKSEPMEFIGSEILVRGRTWGGCAEVLDQLAWARRLPEPSALEGSILLLETSEIIPPPEYIGRWVRALGEGGYLSAVSGIVFAQPVVRQRSESSIDPSLTDPSLAARRHRHREAYIDYLLTNIARYSSDLLVCINAPIGHTRPQAILPYGGEITLDAPGERLIAHFPSN